MGPLALYLPIVEKVVTITDALTGDVTLIYVDLEPPTVTLDQVQLGQTDAVGAGVVELTGTASDTVRVYRVDIRIDDGPWQRAGLAQDGTWRWPWRFADLPGGEIFQVTVRAEDPAGRRTQITEQVSVDLVAPTAGELVERAGPGNVQQPRG